MRIDKPKAKTKNLNTFSLISAILLWGMVAGHISWWAMFAFIPSVIVAFGSEVEYDKQ